MSEYAFLGGFGVASGGIYALTNSQLFYNKGEFDYSKFNFTLAGLHAAAALAVYVLLRDVEDPVYLDFSLTDSKAVLGTKPGVPLETVVEEIRSPISIMQAIIYFYLFTSFTHLVYAWIWKTGYLTSIKEGHNPIRWIEYGISASIMIYVVSIVSGVRDINAILPILGANAVTMYTGYISEEAIRRGEFDSALHAIILGWVLQISIYVTIFRKFSSLIGDIRSIEDPPGTSKYKIPPWLFFVIIPTFLYYGGFGVVASLWYSNAKKTYELTGKLPDYQPTEKRYLYLSLFSKLFLGLYLTFGYTQRGDLDDIVA